MTSSRASRRLQTELKQITEELSKDGDLGWSAGIVGDNIFKWEGFIFGPPDSPFEGGLFPISMEFSEKYPIKPPKVKFTANIPYHPNVYRSGDICLDVLQNAWTPAYQIDSVLKSIRSLLTDPNVDSPANAEAARLYSNDRQEYDARVRSCVLAGGFGVENDGGD